MQSRVLGLCLIALALMLAGPRDFAQTSSVGIVAGTQGPGIELGYQFNDMWGARLEGNYITITDAETVNDIRYKGDADLKSLGLLGDFYLFGSGARVTGGVYLNGNKAD